MRLNPAAAYASECSQERHVPVQVSGNNLTPLWTLPVTSPADVDCRIRMARASFHFGRIYIVEYDMSDPLA